MINSQSGLLLDSDKEKEECGEKTSEGQEQEQQHSEGEEQGTGQQGKAEASGTNKLLLKAPHPWVNMGILQKLRLQM